MSANLELEKQLKLAKRTGSYLVGRREVQSGIKGSKLLVWSASANVPQTILDESRNLSIPSIKFSGNPVELGRACGIPFRVSVIAIKSPGDADLTGFTKSADYITVISGVRSLSLPKPRPSPSEPEMSRDAKAKPKKEPKKKEEEKAPAKNSRKSEEKETEAPKSKEKKSKTVKKSADDADTKPKKARKKKTADETDEAEE
ncbi:MAG: ribosomal L7Ae/L30e/S12e/Gadd45 family protein [Thaumarchaeota archaeon]|nr:ribosomal L7Ae/L30e/S12e/Gadd45 family protein [Nitrososphaerota archaeon]